MCCFVLLLNAFGISMSCFCGSMSCFCSSMSCFCQRTCIYRFFNYSSKQQTSTWHEKTLRVPIYMRFSQPLFDINNLLILKQFSRFRNCNKTAIFHTREHILDTKIAYFFLFQSDIECSFADAFPSKFSFCYKLTK